MKFSQRKIIALSCCLGFGLPISGLAIFLSQRQIFKLSGSQEAYIADLSRCILKNHTLINSRDVAAFLNGKGKDDAQVLQFVSNKKLSSIGISIGSETGAGVEIEALGSANAGTSVNLSTDFNLEGESIKPLILRRKVIDGNHAFQADKGRVLVPKAASKCERLRTDWTLFDEGLNYQFFSDSEINN